MPNKCYSYKAFGINISSSLEIPELMPAEGPPDVTVSLGKVPNFLGNSTRIGARYQTNPGRFLYRVDGIAKYQVSGGNEIIIETCPGAEGTSVRLFLLGSIFAALLHQREMLPLHGSAVKVDGKCVIFAGLSGSGKSTTALAFIKRGYQMQADDVSAISFNSEGIPLVYPEYPQLKLWKNVLLQEGEDPESFTRVRPVLEKYYMPANQHFHHDPLPLKKIYILSPFNQSKIRLSPLKDLLKFSSLQGVIYRHKFTRGLETEVCHFKTATKVCNSVPFSLVERPIQPFLLKELADLLELDFSGTNSGK